MLAEALEEPSFLRIHVPFDTLRERILCVRKKAPRRKTAIFTKKRHPELDSGSVNHSTKTSTDPETSSG